MKKLLLSLTMLVASAITAWAQIEVSTSVVTPENTYSLLSHNGAYMSAGTGATQFNLGRFAFYAAEGENAYKIYSVDAKKWVSYTKADSYSGGANKASLIDEQANAEAWNIIASNNNTYYNIAPYTSAGTVGNQYWNFHGGAGASGKTYIYDDNKTIGFYGDKNDGGSKWTLDKLTLATAEQINAAKALVVEGPGYPKTTSSVYAAMNALTVGTSTTKHIDAAKSVYQTTSDVQLPENGKAYTFTALFQNGNKLYMKYVNGQKVGVSTTASDASTFVCKELRAGVYAFVTEDGHILTWIGNDEGGAYKESGNIFGYSRNYATEYNGKSDWNEITIKKNHTTAEQLGLLRLVARRHKTATSSIIANKNVRFDQASDGNWFNNDNTSGWILTEVEHTSNAAQTLALAKIDAKNTVATKVPGSGVCQYTYTLGDNTYTDATALNAAIDAATTPEALNTLSSTLNIPVAGKYYRIKAVAGWNDDARYLGAKNSTANTSRAEFIATANDSTIFYFDGTQLVSYGSGHYLVSNSNFLGYNGIQTAGSKIAFHAASNNLVGAYNISFNDGGRWLYCHTNNHTDAGGRGTVNGYCFNLEEVTTLPMKVSTLGYATFFAPVAVTLPEGVTAYTGKLNAENTVLNLIAIEGNVVPATTGVILEAAAETYQLTVVDDKTTGTSDLKGSTTTIAKASVAEGIVYTLQSNEQGAAFLRYTGENIPGGKAYLAINNGGKAISVRFGEGTTSIDVMESTVYSQQSAAIYDLTGRRVEAMTKGGIYIMNGKKVVIK